MTDPQPAAVPTAFAGAIHRYHELSERHSRSARTYSVAITLLIAFGLFVVIALPYILSQADKLFRSARNADAVELRITDIEARIDEAIRQTPPYLTLPTFSLTPENEPLYYPGLKPLWPAVRSPNGFWVVAGDEGYLLVSDDDGETWTRQTTYSTAALWPPVFADRTTGVITGSNGTVLTSEDGGQTWSPESLSLTGDLNPPVFSPAGIGIITGDNGHLLVNTATQGGWQAAPDPTPMAMLHPPVFNSAGTGLIAGSEGTLLRSDDGGRRWQVIPLTLTSHLRHLAYDDGRWLVAGDDGALLVFSNETSGWRTVVTATDNALNRPTVTRGGTALVSGENGTLLVSDNDWRQWRPVLLGITSDLHPVTETADGLLIVSGDDGTLLTSNDGGQRWNDQSLGIDTDLNPPVFFDALGLISGDEGVLLLSNNGGRSWLPINTGIPSDFAQPVRSPEGTLFVAGDDGTLLMSTDSGMNWTDLQTGIPTDLNPPVFHDDSVATLSSYGGLYRLMDVTDLLDEDRLTPLLAALSLSTQRTTAETLAQLEEQKALLEDYKTTLVEFDKSDLNDQLEKSLVRVSALAVIMFLVQVLITNYRYSVKLANFYLARAQGLTVISDLGQERLSADDISTLLGTFTPATEFGKQVETPIDKIMALAEKMKKV